jgi:signal transduction histidine kinase/CheY-like chemotaxis protein/HPt (histidine-containing phosphotransfer) domain-containing protein
MENDKIVLTDLINVETLQRIQNSVSEMIGMALLIVDADGKPVTEGSNFTDYCAKNVRCSKIGRRLCEQCDKHGAMQAKEKGHAVSYFCHAGLLNYAAPINVDGQMVGGFIGGQVLTILKPENVFRQFAKDLMLDEDQMANAAKEIPLMTYEDIDKGEDYIYVIAEILSDMANGKYVAQKAEEELLRASNMKSDFLANMSHEIRTPMNAVIGMAEMALREELTPSARDYINQIKSSGRALLTIINDILDYSKIESGKMEITEVEYEPMSLIHDVSSIIMTRLTDKDVELLLDVDPNLPQMLEGDDLRLRQILINLSNNATKFTKSGYVKLTVRYEPIDENNIMLKVWVKDTGIGIKESDMSRLFNSFQQVDSKRNRNVEGTGLGLAICKQLLTFMGGSIHVESVYGEGSTFSFEVPQKLIDAKPSIVVNNNERFAVAGFFESAYVAENLREDADKLSVKTDIFTDVENPEETIYGWALKRKDKEKFLLIEQNKFDEVFIDSLDKERCFGMHIILIADAYADVRQWKHLEYLNIVKKPVSVLALAAILSQKELTFNDASNSESEFNFEAPDAKILVVDDNAINLTVAQGLLEPLHMQIDTALSGKEALLKLDGKHYDIIFMDHMMPELDGIETTRIIRRLHPDCNDTPIIALTANAVSGTKEMFLSEGMNDFIAKPIEVRVLISKVHQWLAPEKIKKTAESAVKEGANAQEGDTASVPDTIGDLDVKAAVNMLGTPKLFWKVLKDYYRVITSKAEAIKKYTEQKDWANYTIEVHALKSASKQIGARTLSDMAAALEKAGNARDVETILKHTQDMLRKYLSYEPVLSPYCKENEEVREKEPITKEHLDKLFEMMREALDNLDMDAMEDVAGKMGQYSYPEEQEAKFEALKEAVSNIDVDTCEELINTWFE